MSKTFDDDDVADLDQQPSSETDIERARDMIENPESVADLRVAIAARCGLDLYDRFIDHHKYPSGVYFRKATLQVIAGVMPNPSGDGRNISELENDDLREYITKNADIEPYSGWFRWPELKAIHDTLVDHVGDRYL